MSRGRGEIGFYLPAMRLHDAGHDGQAQPGAFGFRRAEERGERPPPLFLAHSLPGVPEFDRYVRWLALPRGSRNERDVIVRAPPPGIASAALRIRLSKACSSCVAAPIAKGRSGSVLCVH